MGNACNKHELLCQYLHDIGLNPSEVEECLHYDNQQLKHFLTIYRQDVLNQLHEYQNTIDCVDYLLYQLNKEKM